MRPIRSRSTGITLVELMVAMALMTVLTGTIIFIFTQAQSIYTHVDAKVKVYQYARTALDIMERDLSNVVISPDMDFFQDGNPRNGHYDPGEELGNGVGIDMTEEKQLTLPMVGNTVYHYGFVLRQPKYYSNPAFNDSMRLHSHDSIYFKTITQAMGNTVAAMVEYALVDMQRERPKLQKRLWVLTGMDPGTQRLIINGPPVYTNTTQTTPVSQDLCLYVTDVKFQIFVKNNRHPNGDPADRFTPGTFYTAQDLVDDKIDPITGAAPFVQPMRNYWNGARFQPQGQGDYMVQCFYDPSHDGSATDPGQFDKIDNGLFHTQNNFEFPMLGPGDLIYIFDLNNGGLTAAGMQPNDYTIKGWRTTGPGFPTATNQRIEFINQVSTTSPNFPNGGLQVAYRAGWLPPAVRVTLRIKDEKAKEIRTISRTFKVLATQ